MNLWSALVLIALIAAVAGVIRSRYNAMSGFASDRQSDPVDAKSQREAELEHEVEELRERIQILERIATDGRQAKQIADEIEQLRDK